MQDRCKAGDPVIPAVNTAAHAVVDLYALSLHGEKELDVPFIEVVVVAAIRIPSDTLQLLDCLWCGVLHKCGWIIGNKRSRIVFVGLCHLALLGMSEDAAHGT